MLALAVLAALALVVAELTTLIEIDVASGSCQLITETNPDLADGCVTKGGEQHGFALVFLGLLVLAMGWGAAAGRSRPAAVALIVAGAVALGIALISDLPDTTDEGLIGRNYDQAEASAGIALWLEIAGGALAVAAGLVALVRRGALRPRA